MGNWRVKSIDIALKRRLKEAGVDYVSHRLHALCRMLSYASDALHDVNSNSEDSNERLAPTEETQKAQDQVDVDGQNLSPSLI